MTLEQLEEVLKGIKFLDWQFKVKMQFKYFLMCKFNIKTAWPDW